MDKLREVQLLMAQSEGFTSEQLALLENDEFNFEQAEQVRLGIKQKLPFEKVLQYAKPRFSIEQMELIRRGYLNGWNPEEVGLYSRPEYSLPQMFPIFTTQLTLNAEAQSIAHIAEVTGGAGDEVNAEITRLQTASGIMVESINWDTTWLNSTNKTIQLRTPFTVTLTKKVEIPVINPAMGESGPVTVTLHASASGISEVYYKP